MHPRLIRLLFQVNPHLSDQAGNPPLQIKSAFRQACLAAGPGDAGVTTRRCRYETPQSSSHPQTFGGSWCWFPAAGTSRVCPPRLKEQYVQKRRGTFWTVSFCACRCGPGRSRHHAHKSSHRCGSNQRKMLRSASQFLNRFPLAPRLLSSRFGVGSHVIPFRFSGVIALVCVVAA